MSNNVILIIVFVIIIIRIASFLFKGSAKSHDESDDQQWGDFKPEPSPWDDLIRELKSESEGQNTNKTQRADTEDNTDYSTKEYVFGQYETDQPISQNEGYFTYEAPVYNYDNDVNTLTETQPNLQQKAETLQVASAVKAASSTGDTTRNVFGGDFDPKMAIIYSEIMNPKYID